MPNNEIHAACELIAVRLENRINEFLSTQLTPLPSGLRALVINECARRMVESVSRKAFKSFLDNYDRIIAGLAEKTEPPPSA